MALRADQAVVQEVLEALKGQKRHKYNARRVVVDGFACDSTKEGRRWAELVLLLKAGQIRNLVHHPRFELHAPNGEVIGIFEADASYEEPQPVQKWFARALTAWRLVVEDTKGGATLPLAKWKQRHFAAEHGFRVREVR